MNEIDRRARDGTALALAAAGSPGLMPGRRFAINANYGNYEGAGAVGVGLTGLLHETQAYAVVVSGGLGFGFNTGNVGGRGGVSVQW